MNRRLIIAGAALAAGVALVAAWLLRPGQDPPAGPVERNPGPAVRRVTLYHYWDDSFARLRDVLAEEGRTGNLAHPATRLVVTPVVHEAYKVNAPALLSESGGNELFSWWAGWRTRDLDQRGLLAPLDRWWTAARADDRFSPAVVEQACTYRGRRCMLPLVQCYIGFFYNTAVFSEAGLQPPATWAELLAACRTLRGRGINPVALGTSARWPAQFWFDYLLLRTSGAEYRHRLLEGQAAWIDPQVARVFALWRELLDLGAFNPNPNGSDWLEAAKQVHTRGAAMTLMGTWIMDPYAALGWQGGRDYGWFPFPSVDPGVEAVTLTVVDGLVLARGASDEAAVRTVLDQLSSPAAQLALAQASGNFAPHLGVDAAQYDPLRRSIRASVSDRLDFPYDLATPPEAEQVGLQAMVGFLDAPQRIAEILADAERRIAAGFAARRAAAKAAADASKP
jgi:ABC-type glycerol-3-phosphate transport system substrate-binding protein